MKGLWEKGAFSDGALPVDNKTVRACCIFNTKRIVDLIAKRQRGLASWDAGPPPSNTRADDRTASAHFMEEA